MKKRFNSIKAGLPPGSLIHIGNQKTENVSISIVDYTKLNIIEKNIKSPKECISYIEKDSCSWFNVCGLHETKTVSLIGEVFNLHPLLLEDILNTNHRPKVEEFDDYLFVSLKILGVNQEHSEIKSEQISLVVGKNWLISFQEQDNDIFNSLIQRLHTPQTNIREKGVDYLLYRLIDTIVDNYFYVTEFISEQSEIIEEKITVSTSKDLLTEVQNLKKQLIKAKKTINPLREVLSYMQSDKTNFVHESTARYIHDVYDHIIQMGESLDTQREIISNIMDLYHSYVSNKMNQIMQVLTIISTIFIPLTFIAGIYGMNFEYMPELHWKYGYYSTWGIMILIMITMILFFKRKKWL